MWGLASILARLALVALIFGAGWKVRDGRAHAELAAQLAAEVPKATLAAEAASTAASGAAAARVEIRWRTRYLQDKAHELITPDADRRYPLSLGFVELHDAAAEGRDAADPGGAADAPSDVAASEAGAVVAYNYGACREAFDRLTRLQALLEHYQAIYPAAAAAKIKAQP